MIADCSQIRHILLIVANDGLFRTNSSLGSRTRPRLHIDHSLGVDSIPFFRLSFNHILRETYVLTLLLTLNFILDFVFRVLKIM